MAGGQEARALLERLTKAIPRASHALEAPQPSDGDAFLRRLLRNLPGMAYRCANDDNWTMAFASTGCRRLTGFDSADLVENRVVAYATLIHPADRQRVWDAVQEAAASGGTFEVTYRIRRADGRERWVWEQGCTVLGDDGRVEALEGFITDVTDRTTLRALVTDQDAQVRALVEQGLTGVYLIQQGRFRYVNAFLAKALGYTTEEMMNRAVLDVVHPDDRELVARNLRRRLEGSTDEVRYEFRVCRKDGTVRDVDVHGRRIDFGGRPAVMGALLDVTDRKRAERRFHEGQKMEALGRLARGVAHDLNNFLGAIGTTAQLLRLERGGDHDLADELDHIIAGVARGMGLSRQLMDFGRSNDPVAATGRVPAVLGDLIPMLERVLGDGVRLAVDVESDLPTVRLGRSQLQQVVTNLVLNGGEAIPDEGTVTVSARTLAECSTSGEDARDGPQVVLEVTDDGVGIPEDVRRKIFEPYFTTKGLDGTGLGLANVWRIVQDAGGRIEVDSTPGAGSTFRVLLPVEGSVE